MCSADTQTLKLKDEMEHKSLAEAMELGESLGLIHYHSLNSGCNSLWLPNAFPQWTLAAKWDRDKFTPLDGLHRNNKT